MEHQIHEVERSTEGCDAVRDFDSNSSRTLKPTPLLQHVGRARNNGGLDRRIP